MSLVSGPLSAEIEPGKVYAKLPVKEVTIFKDGQSCVSSNTILDTAGLSTPIIDGKLSLCASITGGIVLEDCAVPESAMFTT